jgi:malto-oligosyltrehalose trehalohydrolase
MTRRRHDMPFGAQARADGSTRFRLWAPAAQRIELCLAEDSGERLLEMPATSDGWYELTTAAAAGDRYRYRVDGDLRVPDPASRFQPDGLHGFSEIVDPADFDWRDDAWHGRPWHEAVIYELHVGAFSADGAYAGVERRLDHLMDLGVTALELMPLAAFPGRRNWGYDGALLFAPDAAYGRPADLKHLVQRAHERGLMVLLDVVYNHFGPDGNYLHRYAPAFFTERHHTPWGAAINFDGADSAVVREFFIHNALYWLDEFHLDGLRLDAVHAIADDSRPHILDALAAAVRAGPAAEREVHLVLENDDNAAHYLRPRADSPADYRAQWNDDCHHVLHLLGTGETDGYYADYVERPPQHLARALAEGFAYQGEPSRYRGGGARGEPSRDLPPTAFVNFLQNHDQVGNRAFGERIGTLVPPEALRALSAVLLLAPSPPLLFMGQEFAADAPFLFFCDFHDELAAAVTDGRRTEFARFARFADAESRRAMPDPNAPSTFERSRLDWQQAKQAPHSDWLQWHRHLLNLRGRQLAPRLAGTRGGRAAYALAGERGLEVVWELGDGSRLGMLANLGDRELHPLPRALPNQRLLLHTEPAGLDTGQLDRMPPWSVIWWLNAG